MAKATAGKSGAKLFLEFDRNTKKIRHISGTTGIETESSDGLFQQLIIAFLG